MYTPDETRYEKMKYRHCGKSGLRLPELSLGLWQNFGKASDLDNAEKMVQTAFDLGITQFDLANNYGHPYNGSAEENFKVILDRGMRAYRDEMVITTKAGYEMWPGPYGDRNGSRKYLTASLDQSLKRMGLDYVDIYYHHIFDPNTPLEETALALDNAVKQGKALYVGVSNYDKTQTERIKKIFDELKTPFIVNQPSYSMLNRWIEHNGLDRWAKDNGVGLCCFSPLYQGFLTERYLFGIPEDSRIGKGNTWIKRELTPKMVAKLRALSAFADNRGQKLSQLALSWILSNPAVTSVIIGASRPEQITENVKAIENTAFSPIERSEIDGILNG
ncbi:MAG: aldo/keto reductase [Ruminococcus sp.]|nr:aldo/keto reductase [Ruminococcus sp.]